MEGTVPCSPRASEGSFSSLSSFPCPAQLAMQDNRRLTACRTTCTGYMEPSVELRASGSSPTGCFTQEQAPSRSSTCPSVPGPVLGTENTAMLQG